jgi:hypothetical protein
MCRAKHRVAEVGYIGRVRSSKSERFKAAFYRENEAALAESNQVGEMNQYAAKVIAQFEALYAQVKELRASYVGHTDYVVQYLVELEKRTWQMLWLLREIDQREEVVPKLHMASFMLESAGQKEEGEKQFRKGVEEMTLMETFAESFYLFAFRALDMLRGVPNLNFSAAGVTNVRNHLIIHSGNEKTGVFPQSFGLGGPEGPTLKNARHPGDENKFQDPGLWKNAEEYCNALSSKLRAFPRGPTKT